MVSHQRRLIVVSSVLVLLSVCVQLNISAPLQGDDDPQVVKLAYKKGQSYVYDFSTNVVTKLVGTSDEESRIKVNGQFLLTATSETEFILKVKSASFETPSGQTLSGTNAKLEGTSIGFTNDNGVLKCSVSLEKDDPTWSANIKRALASLFTNHAYREGQFPALRYNELDVSGYNCITEYAISGNKYEKKRNLNTCSKRDGSFTSAQATLYSVEEEDAPNTDTALRSSQNCVQIFDSGLLQSTECTETHKLDFLSNDDAAATTTVSSSIKYVSTSNEVSSPTFDTSTQAKIFFDFSDEDKASENVRAANVVAILKDLCTEITSIVTSSEVSDKYLRLKREVSRSSESGLREAFDSLKSGSTCASAKDKLIKLYLKAVASAGTSDSIAFFAPLYKDDSLVDERTARSFRVNMAFALRPKDNALSAINKLISPDTDPKFLLTASGLGHQYCHSTANCEQSSVYNDFVSAVSNYASSNCLSSDRNSVDKAIAGLQALGNLHSLTGSSQDTIVKCLGGADRIKINALQAFRRNPCVSEAKNAAKTLLLDPNSKSHISIHAYIALSKCLTTDEANLINDKIKESALNQQVTNYICSHVQNTLESVSAGRVKANERDIFSLITSCGKVHKDVRKYSSNLESSHYEATENVGYSAEANFIYSADSFLPKTISTNLTFDHAGKSYNFLEFGINSADFEDYMDDLYGPGKKRAQDLKDNDISHHLSPAHRHHIRQKRAKSVAPTFDSKSFEKYTKAISTKVIRETKGVSDVYIRIWGTTIATRSFTLEEILECYKKSNSPKSNAEKFKELFLTQNLDIAESLPLLGDELIVPTVSGLPLRVAVDGSMMLSLKVASKLDEGALSLDSSWTGSGTILVRGRQTVGSGPIEAGLQLDGKLYVSHNSGHKVKVVRGTGNSANIEVRSLLPTPTIRTFECSSKIYWVESKNYELPTKTELKYKAPIDKPMSIYANFNPYFALETQVIAELAGGVASEYPKFPLNGPAKFEGFLKVTDPAVKEMIFQIDYKENESRDDRSGTIIIDMPGGKVDRKMEFVVKVKGSPGNTDQSMTYSSARVKAGLFATEKTVGTANDKEIKVSYNGKDYGVKIHTDIVKEEHQAGTETNKLKFDASYYSPDGSGTLLKGNGERTKKTEGDKVISKLTFSGETDVKNVKSGASGTIEYERTKDSSEYQLEFKEVQGSHSALGQFNLNGKMSGSKKLKTSFWDVSLKYGDAKKLHDLAIVLNLDGGSKEGRNFAEAKLASSRRPELNFDFKFEKDFGAAGKKVGLTYNRAGTASVVFNSDFQVKADGFESNSDLKVTCSKSNTDFNMKSKIVKAGKNVNSDITLNSGSDLNAVSKFDADYAAQSYNFKTEGKGYGKEFSYISSLKSAGNTKTHKVDIKVKDGFDLGVATDLVQDDSKASVVFVVTSDKFLTQQPVTVRFEIYPDGVFKDKNYKNVKKSVIQVLVGTSRITSLIAEKVSSTNYKLEFYQVNIIEATVEVASSKGVIVLDTDVNVPSKRRVISKFEVKRAGRNIDFTAEIQWDANNDKSKVLSYTASTVLDGSNVKTKNSLDISGSKHQLNIDSKINAKQIFNEDHSIDIEYISGAKTYTVGIESRFDLSPNRKGEKVGVKIELPGQTPLHFKLDTQLKDVDLEKYFFDYTLNYEGDISEDDVKDQFLKFNLVRKPVNGGRSVTLEASGRIISEQPKGIKLQIDVQKDAAQLSYVRKDANTKVASVDASLSRDLSAPLKVLSGKISYDKDFSNTIPSASADITYKYIFNSFKDFQITEVFALTYDDISSSGENAFKLNENEFSFKTITKYEKPGTEPVVIQDLEINGGAKDNAYNVLVDVRNFFKNPMGSEANKFNPRFEIELAPTLPNLNLVLSAERVPIVGTVQFKLKHGETAVNGGQKRTSDVYTKIGSQVVGFTSALEFSTGKAATDFTIKFNNDAERKLSLLVQDTGSGPTAEASVTWGPKPEESIKSKGTVVKSANGGFDADLVFDKTPLSSKWTLKVKRTVESASKAKLEFNAESPETQQVIKVLLDRNINLAAQSTIKANYDIAVSKYVTGKHSGKIQIDLDRKAFDPKTEKKGTQFKLDFEGSKESKVIDKTNIVVKVSDNEKRFTISSECASRYCGNGAAILKTSENEGSLEITRVSEGLKTGLVVEGSKSSNWKTLKSDVQVFFARDSKQEQYSVFVFKEPGEASDVNLVASDISSPANSIERAGYEIKLGERTIGATSATAKWNSPEATSCQLNFWLDKSRKPNERFSYSVTAIPKNSENARNFIFISKGPVNDKVFRIKTTNRLLPENNFDVNVELDIYKRKEDAFVVAFKRVLEGNGDSFKISITSEGQGIAYSKDCNLNKDVQVTSLNCGVKVKTPGAADSSYTFTGSSGDLVSSAKFEQLTPEKRSYYYAADFNERGCLKKLVYELPGFTPGDFRTVTLERLETPKGYKLKSSLKSEGDDYDELFAGQIRGQGLGIKTTRMEKGVTQDIWEIRRFEKNTHLRSYEILWNAENIKKSLSRFETIAVQRSENLAALFKARAEEVRKRVAGVKESIKNARVDLNPTFDYLKSQIESIGKELRIDTADCASKVDKLRDLVNKRREFSSDSVLAKSIDQLAAFAATGKDRIPENYGKVRSYVDAVSKLKNFNLHELYGAQLSAFNRKVYAQFKQINDAIQKFQDENKGKLVDKAIRFIRAQLATRYGKLVKENEQDYYKLYPYPEMREAYEPMTSYVKQRIATPDKKTLNDDFREIMFTKLDAALKAIQLNTLQVDFAGGHIVANIPVYTQLTMLKNLFAVSRDKSGLFSGLWKFYGLFPAPGYGYIYGTKDFVTFDGKEAQFGNSKQYLLASDFANNAFTAAIDISKGADDKDVKALYVSDSKDNGVILQDGTVFLNGKKERAGSKAGNLQVVQEGYDWVGIKNVANGVTIACKKPGRWTNIDELPCVVKISGFYHGKVKGVLGHFNSEVKDDSENSQDFVL